MALADFSHIAPLYGDEKVMDRRREPRIPLEQQGWITLLGDPEVRCPATAIDLSGRGMKLRLSRQLAPHSPVKVEIGDSMYLAEVCYCRLERGTFIAGLAIEQVLTGLQGLGQLRRRLISDLPKTMDAPSRDRQDREMWDLDHAQ